MLEAKRSGADHVHYVATLSPVLELSPPLTNHVDLIPPAVANIFITFLTQMW